MLPRTITCRIGTAFCVIQSFCDSEVLSRLHCDNPAVARNTTVSPPAPWWLYLLECEGGVYYAGIALDVEQRFFQHVFGRGAKFTRARPPLRVLAARAYASKGDALRAELALKALPRARKLVFFEAADC